MNIFFPEGQVDEDGWGVDYCSARLYSTFKCVQQFEKRGSQLAPSQDFSSSAGDIKCKIAHYFKGHTYAHK